MNNELEINLKDLIIYWLIHFRSMIVLSVLGFFIVGSLRVYMVNSFAITEKVEAMSQEDNQGIQDKQVVAAYRLVLSNDKDLDKSTMNIRYITIDGTDETTAKNIVNAFVANIENDIRENVIYEVNVIEEVEEVEEVDSSMEFIKHGFAASVILILIHAMWWSMIYISTGRIRTKSQQDALFEIMELGGLRTGEFKLYKGHSKIDLWLRSIAEYKEFSEDECMEMAIIKLKKLLSIPNREKEKINIVITGQASCGLKERLIKDMAKAFDYVSCIEVADIINNASDLEKLLDADYVIFVERYGSTRWHKLSEEINHSLQAGVKIAGCVWE